MAKQNNNGLTPTSNKPAPPPAPTPQQPTPTPQPTQPTTPQAPQNVITTDPYGSGATFSGNPNSPQYQQSLEKWLVQREQAYKQSQKYQQDQYRDNPDIRSGLVPSVGFTAETINPWGVPVGATVTNLEKSTGGYIVSYKEKGTPQEVTVSGAGYSITGTVYAKNQQEAAAKMIAGSTVQYRGVDVSPRQLGGKILVTGSKNAEVIVGDPELNEYWLKMGLPQYAGYDIPKLSTSQEAVGFYIKKVEAGGLAPNVSIANKEWESFWTEQGYSEYGDYQPVALGSDEYVKAVNKTEQGLSFQVGNRSYEKKWQELGYPEYGDYEPPALGQDDYIKSVVKDEQGLTYTVGNRKADAEQAALEVRLNDLNRQLDVINRQNDVFTSSVNKGDIDAVQYRDAMKAQTQNTLKLLNEAESLGFITPDEKVTQSKQLSSFMGSIDAFALNVGKYNKLTSTIEAENEVFASKLQSGDISQDDYVKALGFQNQRVIGAINQAAKDDLFTAEAAKAASVATSINFQNFLNEVKLNRYTPAETIEASSNLDNAFKMSGIKQQANIVANIRQGTKAEGITEAKILGTLTPSEQQQYLGIKTEKALYAGVSVGVFVAAGATIPFSLPTSLTFAGVKVVATQAVLGAGLSVGINQTVKGLTGGGLLTPQEAAVSAGEGLLFLGANKLALNAVKVVAPRVAASAVGRAGVATGIGITGEYITTGKVTPEGVATAGLMAIGFEGIGIGVRKLYSPIKAGIEAKTGISTKQGILKESDITITPFKENGQTVYRMLTTSDNIKFTPYTTKQGQTIYRMTTDADIGIKLDAIKTSNGQSIFKMTSTDTGFKIEPYNPNKVSKNLFGTSDFKVKPYKPEPVKQKPVNLVKRSYNFGDDLGDRADAFYYVDESTLASLVGRYGSIARASDTGIIGGSNVGKTQVKAKTPSLDDEIMLNLLRPDLTEQRTALYWEQRIGKITEAKDITKGSNKGKNINISSQQRNENAEFLRLTRPDIAENLDAVRLEQNIGSLKDTTPRIGGNKGKSNINKDPFKTDDLAELAKQRMINKGVPEEFITKAQRVNIEAAWGEPGVKGLKLYDKPDDGFTAMMKRLKGLSAEEQAKAQMREMNLPEEFIEKSVRVNIESAWGEGGTKGLLRYPSERQERSVADLIKSLAGKKEPNVIQPADSITGLPKNFEDYIKKTTKRSVKPFDSADGSKAVDTASGQQLIMLEKPQQVTTQKTKIKTSQQQQNNVAALIENEKVTAKTRKATRQKTALAALNEVGKADTDILTAPPTRVTIGAFPSISVTPLGKQKIKSDIILNPAQVFKTETTQKPKITTAPKIVTNPKIKQAPTTTAIQTQTIMPKISVRMKPAQIPKTATALRFKTQPAQTVASKLKFDSDQILKNKQLLSFRTNRLTFQTPKMNFPPPLSNDNAFKDRTPKNPNGKWFVKKHKVKTYDQMLNTFGVGQIGKEMKGIEKRVKQIGRGTRHGRKTKR